MNIFYESSLALTQKRHQLERLLERVFSQLVNLDYIGLDLTEEESELFLYMLEKSTNFTWSSGAKPTEITYFSRETKRYLIIVNPDYSRRGGPFRRLLFHSDADEFDGKVLSVEGREKTNKNNFVR